jgi:Holliday junction resolvase RusA-like endonuclease
VILLDVSIPGDPVGKGRPRVVRLKSGKTLAFTPNKTASWQQKACWCFRGQWKGEPFREPVSLTMLAVKSRPKRLMRKKDQDGLIVRPAKPDCDNVAKAVMDALETSGVLLNDIQVVELHAFSYYAEKGGAPRVEVHLEKIS